MNTPRPSLSVCIPTCNGATYLGEAIASVLDQNLDLELIVVDDASTDKTAEMARAFQDPRIRHYSNRVRRGLVGNWNRCLELARAKYVCIFHQDDIMMAGNLAAKVELLERNPRVGFVHSNVLQVGPRGELLSSGWTPSPDPGDAGVRAGAAVLDELLRGGNVVCASSVVLRRECLEALGPFDGRLPYTADWEMWMRTAVFFDVGYLVEPLVKYRRHLRNHTLQFVGADALEHAYRAKMLVLEKCGGEIPAAGQLGRYLAHWYWNLALEQAHACSEQGDYREVRRCLRAAETFAIEQDGGRDPNDETQLRAARVELEQMRNEVRAVRGRIAAMETSKFWTMRREWFRVKRALGLPADE